MAKAGKTFMFKKHFVGLPKEDDFDLVDTTLRELEDGEFLFESQFLSVDPYMRLFTSQLPTGIPMIGSGVGKVTESKNENYPVNSIVVGPCGWTTHFIVTKELVKSKEFLVIPSDMQMSHSLGTLGMPGMTAYFGLLDICNPKEGETVFVNAAAGAVGNVVGQIAKIKGCRVVGCAGSDEKLKYLKEIGFDAVFNYKNADFEKTFSELCPKGIDCFFENVGGAMFDAAMNHMNKYGRIAVIGGISGYNSVHEPPKGPYIHLPTIMKELKIQGFMAGSYTDRNPEGFKQLNSWINEGKLKVREKVIEGFENMPKALISLFHGEHIGKVVVSVK
ncbi:prostaglandin reductase 1-like [Hydractinia symbiolongicarpus]|uniref:prostaglandin reductase 1-like n=1 Tax=Hydractinia symbiolongicarpus TaxID=13093 RepID=UPI0025516522|nr:prostaglandin reductase 1-like [Hydractinia symbiolongicarpus]